MNFLKRVWRKLFGVKTGSYETVHLLEHGTYIITSDRPAYDPSQDDEKILNGEVESYFEN